MARLDELQRRLQKKQEKSQLLLEQKKALAEREAKMSEELLEIENQVRQETINQFAEKLNEAGCDLMKINLEVLDYAMLAQFILEMQPDKEKMADDLVEKNSESNLDEGAKLKPYTPNIDSSAFEK